MSSVLTLINYACVFVKDEAFNPFSQFLITITLR